MHAIYKVTIYTFYISTFYSHFLVLHFLQLGKWANESKNVIEEIYKLIEKY
jgi:hypothetical protein